jgi:hypothetical protein
VMSHNLGAYWVATCSENDFICKICLWKEADITEEC